MPLDLKNTLQRMSENKKLPGVIAYNRIDGPGSSLDLREFQQTFWNLPQIPEDLYSDLSMKWTHNLPRTIGITINVGTKIEAHPFKSGYIGIKSTEYGTETEVKFGEVVPTKNNWILKAIEIFGLSGVKFVLKNLSAGTISAGLGGSATTLTGVCILANELAKRPFNEIQLVSMSSRIEQDLGVSITGTQEQSNVIFGGVTDYIWFPWGIPGHTDTGYGESIRCELIKPEAYQKLEKRMAVFHSKHSRESTVVNSVWREKLRTQDGYKLHSEKLEIAYQFREGLRLNKWDQVKDSIDSYRKIRTKLCPQYLNGSKEIVGRAEPDSSAFPLGAGGGGGILVFSPEPDSLQKLKEDLSNVYREIPFKILTQGHKLVNIDQKEK